ncbi:DUF2855 family protein [Sandaracinobacter sp. RS1-74]|uniref:DUF2855 family protein n=1 Tax=Sandaracinobacteroides sayramensis TaxID=2913411 RepID=UPI001EDA54AC|nr:DUF2855 family protein [Sandaracinobacteroides sayramensis]MCG2840991.1 DUF2855 family protein [Sandaracinobacteroides sayramensis]
MAPGYRIERRRDRLTEARIEPIDLAPGEGEIVAHVEMVSLTSNNVTYAVHGGAPLHYWDFFPASGPEWGVVPVWGFATVAESRRPDIAVGARFFGYWPSATQLRLQPGPLKAGGFADMAPHRQGLAPVYNHYRPAGGVADRRSDELMALFQPLYGTGHVLAEALRADAEAGRHLILTSASSKTALATAWNLARAGHPPIGLTSARNREFVEATGYYRAVLGYEELGELDGGAPSVLVDFAGNGALRTALHRHLQALTASHAIGDTDWKAPPAAGLPGPQPQFFFAPTHWEAQARAQGPAAFEADLAASRDAFAESTRGWLELEHVSGADAGIAAFDRLMAGEVSPREGLIWRP